MKKNLKIVFILMMVASNLVAQKKKSHDISKTATSFSKEKKESKTINAIYRGFTGISVTDKYSGRITNSYLYVMLNKQNVIVTCIGSNANDLTNPSNWLNSGTYKIVGNKILVNFTHPENSTPTYLILENGDIKISNNITLIFLTSSF